MRRQITLEAMTLETFDGGGMAEQANAALAEIVRNIRDVNADPKAVRSLDIKIQFKPGDDREKLAIKYSVNPKLAGPPPVITTGYAGYDEDGQPVMYSEVQLDALPPKPPTGGGEGEGEGGGESGRKLRAAK
jgi:hypothetical protein